MVSQLYPDETFQLLRVDVRRQGQIHAIGVGQLEIGEAIGPVMPSLSAPLSIPVDVNFSEQGRFSLVDVLHCSRF